jgi:phosphodiesterase/alkaline phosphatase D-like protein
MDDRFELPYEALLQTTVVRHTLRRLPLFTTVDDHEIDNNWEPGLLKKPKSASFRRKGLQAYFRVQRAAGPPIPSSNLPALPPVWYSTDIDGFECFFADTRSERRKRTAADLRKKQIMSLNQRVELRTWLNTATSGAPRFVISGSILLPRRKITSCGPAAALNSDAWDGYPRSLEWLLGLIANRGLQDLVFLSGDEHHSCIATVKLTPLGADPSKNGPTTVLHSIHSSALNAPFRFANGEPADLAGTESFCFDNPDAKKYPWPRIRCDVETHFVAVPGDGFAVFDCRRATAKEPWQVDCEFSRPGNPDRYLLDAVQCRRIV